MRTVEDILFTFHLTEAKVALLSKEAKERAIDCGKKESAKQLSEETWDLFDEMSQTVWQSSIPTGQKIELGFELFELFPDYYHFLVPFYRIVRDSEAVDESEKQIIWKKFMKYLAAEDHYADPVGYVLWVEFFEDTDTVNEAWNGLMKNVTTPAGLLKLLEHAGPVPYDLKEPVYKGLLADPANHTSIFRSILYSAFDVYGQLERGKATKLLSELNIDRTSDEYKQLMLKLK